MLKKINAILLMILLAGCNYWHNSDISNHFSYYSPKQPTYKQVELTDYSQVDLGNTSSFRVALLLPLSGKVADMGQSMKNAAMMAIGDINNNNLVVQFYDTKSTGSGARVAAENAINADSDLILGPLLSEEVSAISSLAKSRNIPVISFSTSPSVLQEGVYSIGLLGDTQIERIVKYAVNNNRTRLAAVFPDNQSGINMFRALMKSARNSGAEVIKVGFYSPETMDFTSLVKAMRGKTFTEGEDIELDFNALLIPESGNKLKAISSMFNYYDVSAPNVLFLGTSIWANSSLSKETGLYGAVYPVMSLSKFNHFAERYNDMFGERPSGLSIFAYDAISLASALSGREYSIYQNISNPEGYNGMSGLFRIFENGHNEHSLDIVKVTAGGEKVIESAPQRFHAVYPNSHESYYSGYINMPQIIGKNAAELQNMLMNNWQ